MRETRSSSSRQATNYKETDLTFALSSRWKLVFREERTALVLWCSGFSLLLVNKEEALGLGTLSATHMVPGKAT